MSVSDVKTYRKSDHECVLVLELHYSTKIEMVEKLHEGGLGGRCWRVNQLELLSEYKVVFNSINAMDLSAMSSELPILLRNCFCLFVC